ncbi:hypothetical protein ACRAWF_01905 [Streptomyces sp. L7]
MENSDRVLQYRNRLIVRRGGTLGLINTMTFNARQPFVLMADRNNAQGNVQRLGVRTGAGRLPATSPCKPAAGWCLMTRRSVGKDGNAASVSAPVLP